MNASGTRLVLAFVAGALIVSGLAFCSREETPAAAAPASTPESAPATRPAEPAPMAEPPTARANVIEVPSQPATVRARIVESSERPAPEAAPEPAKAAPAPAVPPAPAPAPDTSKPVPPIGDFKIGIVNLKDCFDHEKYAHVKNLQGGIDAKRVELQKDIDKRTKEINSLINRMRELPPEAALYQEYRRQVVLKNAQLEAFQKVGNAEYKELVRDYRADIYEEVIQAVREIATEEAIDLVLKADAPATEEEPEKIGSIERRLISRAVLFHTDPIDITTKVIKRMNETYAKKMKELEKNEQKQD